MCHVHCVCGSTMTLPQWISRTVQYAAERAENNIVRMRTSARAVAGVAGTTTTSTDTEVEEGINRLNKLRAYIERCKWGQDNNDGPLPTQSTMLNEWIATVAPSLFTVSAWRHAKEHIMGFEGWDTINPLHLTVMMRRGGKTESIKRAGAAIALSAMPDEVINIYAQKADQSRAILSAIAAGIEHLEPNTIFQHRTSDYFVIIRDDGTRVTVMAHSGDSGRGNNGRINIIDETFFISMKKFFNNMIQNAAVEGVCFIMISSNADTETAVALQTARIPNTNTMACRILKFREVCEVCEREGKVYERCRHAPTLPARHLSETRKTQIAAIGRAAGYDKQYAAEALNVVGIKANAVLPYDRVRSIFDRGNPSYIDQLVDVRHIIVGIDPWGGSERSSMGIVTAVTQVATLTNPAAGTSPYTTGLVIVGIEDVGYAYQDPQHMCDHVVAHIRAVVGLSHRFRAAQIDVVMEARPLFTAQTIALAVSNMTDLNVAVWSSDRLGVVPGITPDNRVKVAAIDALRVHVINNTLNIMDPYISISDAQAAEGMLHSDEVLMSQMCALEPEATHTGVLTFNSKGKAGRDDVVCALAFVCRYAHGIHNGWEDAPLLFPYQFEAPGFNLSRKQQDARMQSVLATEAVRYMHQSGACHGAPAKRPRVAKDDDDDDDGYGI